MRMDPSIHLRGLLLIRGEPEVTVNAGPGQKGSSNPVMTRFPKIAFAGAEIGGVVSVSGAGLALAANAASRRSVDDTVVVSGVAGADAIPGPAENVTDFLVLPLLSCTGLSEIKTAGS